MVLNWEKKYNIEFTGKDFIYAGKLHIHHRTPAKDARTLTPGIYMIIIQKANASSHTQRIIDRIPDQIAQTSNSTNNY